MVESSEADTNFLSVGAMLMERHGSRWAGMTCSGSKKLSLRPFHSCPQQRGCTHRQAYTSVSHMHHGPLVLAPAPQLQHEDLLNAQMCTHALWRTAIQKARKFA